MKINYGIGIQNARTDIVKKDNNPSEKSEYTNDSAAAYSYPAVYFCGKISPKKIDIVHEKDKLIKQMNKILEDDVSEMNPTEILLKTVEKANSFYARKKQIIAELQSRMEELNNNKLLNSQQKREQRNQLIKEFNRVKKSKPQKYEPPKKKEDTGYDFTLINKFKSALLEDNFNLRGVYRDYYSSLKEVKTVEELRKLYPAVKVPPKPSDVVGEKIAKSLTKDFFMNMHEIVQSGDKDKYVLCVLETVGKAVAEHFPEAAGAQRGKVIRSIIESTTDAILKRYREIERTNSFASVPENIRLRTPIFTESDKKLLSVDYDDFILSTLREQHAGLKKPSEIVYRSGDTEIKLSEIQQDGYKFEKIPEKVRIFVNTGETLKNAQRDYANYSVDEFRARLSATADTVVGENEELLKRILEFDGCKYTAEDIEMVREFLRTTDKVIDGDKTVEEALSHIHEKSIYPKGTAKINEAERQEHLQKVKLQQKERAKLAHAQKTFDDNINLLYQNGMAYLAEICSKYRPRELNPQTEVNLKYIEEIINSHINSADRTFENKYKLSAAIYRWDKYNEYCTNPNADKKVLERARKFAGMKDGEVDIDRAGQYITNVESLETYMESPELVPQRQIIELIEARTTDSEKAIETLCKYDDYCCLESDAKTRISNIMEILSSKDEVEKSILDEIIKTEYNKTETFNMAETGGFKIETVIAPDAKEAVYDYYGFPNCLEFFEDFEKASKKWAVKSNDDGIKYLGRNNKKLEDEYELKIKSSPDRLKSTTSGRCYFDKYVPKGYHKNKTPAQ